MTSRQDIRLGNNVTIKGGNKADTMTHKGTTRRRPYLIVASIAVLSLGIGIGSGIGIGFGIFHTQNPCDGMKIRVVENLKFPANQTACVGLNTHGNFVKLTSNSEACNNACEAYHHKSAQSTGLTESSGRRKLTAVGSNTHTVTAYQETTSVKKMYFDTEVQNTLKLHGHLNHPDILVEIDGVERVLFGVTLGVHTSQTPYYKNDDKEFAGMQESAGGAPGNNDITKNPAVGATELNAALYLVTHNILANYPYTKDARPTKVMQNSFDFGAESYVFNHEPDKNRYIYERMNNGGRSVGTMA